MLKWHITLVLSNNYAENSYNIIAKYMDVNGVYNPKYG